MDGTCNTGACHARTTTFSSGGVNWQGTSDPRYFTDESQGRSFASSRSPAGANSLFLRKPSGSCTAGSPCNAALENQAGHFGGTLWANGSANYNTVLAWINGGRAARNSVMPPFINGHTPAEIVIAVNGHPMRVRGTADNPYALLTPPSR